MWDYACQVVDELHGYVGLNSYRGNSEECLKIFFVPCMKILAFGLQQCLVSTTSLSGKY